MSGMSSFTIDSFLIAIYDDDNVSNVSVALCYTDLFHTKTTITFATGLQRLITWIGVSWQLTKDNWMINAELVLLLSSWTHC